MKKDHCTFNISREVNEHRKKNPRIKHFGDWVDTKYREAFMNLETEKEKLEHMRAALEMQEALVKELITGKNEIDELPESAMAWLKSEGLDRLSKGFDMAGVLKFFNNEFGLSLSLRQFKIYVDEVNNSN